MNSEIFFRVAKINTPGQGLWWSWDGKPTNLIGNNFKFCTNTSLPMPFDERLVGWLSVATSLEGLFMWFTREDIAQLEKEGYRIAVYAAYNYKEYKHPDYVHMAVEQATSNWAQTISVNNVPMTDLEKFEARLRKEILTI